MAIYRFIAAYTFLLSTALSSPLLLQPKDVLSHLHNERANGARSKFTLEIQTRNSAIQVDVIEAPSAISPSATYSLFDRPSREVGHLGYYNLVTAKDGVFVSMTVNSATGEVRGVIKQFGGDWIRVGDNVESDEFDAAERFLHHKDAVLAEEMGDKEIISRVEDSLYVHGSKPLRELQTFHSSYLYQVDLHLDFDYELVALNGGTLCNTFSYINSLVTAANVVFEKEVMTHINVKSIRQTEVYNEVSTADEVLEIMRAKNAERQWHNEGIDLHYALLGKTKQSELGFIEDSICDSVRGFGFVSGIKGSFDGMDEKFGADLKMLMYAFA
jgi:hypothetical protein